MPEARVIPLHGEQGRNGAHRAAQAAVATAQRKSQAGNDRQDLSPVRVVRRPVAQDPVQPEPSAAELASQAMPAWEERLADLLAFLRRRASGDYQIDEFGFDREFADHLVMPTLRPLYERWFRVETLGMSNVPAEGGALLVANHSGVLPIDAMMTTVALRDHHPAGRHLRMLGADLLFRTPMLGSIARKAGHTLACNPDAERLLNSDELVGVWPEGYKGVGKPFKDRYKLQRFGRGGFVSAAMRTGVPIIPCSIVGAEEIFPMVADLKPLARLFGLPYFPITPTFPLLGPLGMVPLPSKWYIEFGEPIRTDRYDPADAEDPMLVFNITDQVRETIQQTLYSLLSQRRNAFTG
ncbi:lysophospholipid acyltransferase family protein [Pseudonocardia spinosispora]|uniref:lysophospholipid acyltransferase family protein n=1 Tax=Pseudonocardia spinosispora TaxID=103441 RepID=UPI000404246B|nr:lysophospholipid acyltransferase family protein [Pseudonocardia spinosispora]